jgi:hypothetical protein
MLVLSARGFVCSSKKGKTPRPIGHLAGLMSTIGVTAARSIYETIKNKQSVMNNWIIIICNKIVTGITEWKSMTSLKIEEGDIPQLEGTVAIISGG